MQGAPQARCPPIFRFVRDEAPPFLPSDSPDASQICYSRRYVQQYQRDARRHGTADRRFTAGTTAMKRSEANAAMFEIESAQAYRSAKMMQNAVRHFCRQEAAKSWLLAMRRRGHHVRRSKMRQHARKTRPARRVPPCRRHAAATTRRVAAMIYGDKSPPRRAASIRHDSATNAACRARHRAARRALHANKIPKRCSPPRSEQKRQVRERL